MADAIAKRPLTLIPQAWPGSDFIQDRAFGQHRDRAAEYAASILHRGIRETCGCDGCGAEVDIAELARVVQVGLDLLIMSFAQAEGMETDGGTKYANLRAYWGIHLNTNVQSWAGSRPRNASGFRRLAQAQ